MVGVPALWAERLVSIIRYLGFLFQTAPAGIVAVLIGHLTRDADVVAVEVVHFLTAFAFGTGVVVHLREQFIAVGIGVDIGIPAVWVDFLQEVAAVPNEAGFVFFADLQTVRNQILGIGF